MHNGVKFGLSIVLVATGLVASAYLWNKFRSSAPAATS
jgi:hypothetical protein